MIKKYKPTTPGQRHRTVIIDTNITKSDLLDVKHLKQGKSKTGCRNNTGRITVRHRGGGHKKLLRNIDRKYKRNRFGDTEVIQVEYSPQMSANLFLCKPLNPKGDNNHYFYRLATNNISKGHIFKGPYTQERQVSPGDVRFLKHIPKGKEIHSIEMLPGKGSALVRSAGTFAILVAHLGNGFCNILLPSKKTITLNENCLATVGQVGNDLFKNKKAGKAGALRWKGRRPIVRGEAMNAVDHPHGGGSHSSGGTGKPIKNIWGRLAKF